MTRTVELSEVKANLQEWVPSITNEVLSLTIVQKAVESITTEELEALRQQHPGLVVFPAKGVFVIKPGGKKKTRIVACGNFVAAADSNVYAATQVDTTSL